MLAVTVTALNFRGMNSLCSIQLEQVYPIRKLYSYRFEFWGFRIGIAVQAGIVILGALPERN